MNGNNYNSMNNGGMNPQQPNGMPVQPQQPMGVPVQPQQPVTPIAQPVPEMPNASVPIGEPAPEPVPAPAVENPTDGSAPAPATPTTPAAPTTPAPVQPTPVPNPTPVVPQPMPAMPQPYGQPAGQISMIPYPNQIAGQNPKSNHKKFIIAGIVVALVVVIAIVLAVVFLGKDKKEKPKTSNEYEESGSNSNSSSNVEEPVDDNTITFGGLKFQKVDGYTYSVDDNILVIQGATKQFHIALIDGSFQTWTSNVSKLQSDLTKVGAIATYPIQGYYDGKYMLTSTLQKDSLTMMYAITQSPYTDYCFEIAAVNAASTTADYNLYNDAVKFLDGIVEEGETSPTTKDTNSFFAVPIESQGNV